MEYDGGSWKLEVPEQRLHVHVFIPKFLKWLNDHQIVRADEHVDLVRLSDDRIFDYPFLFVMGHYDFSLSAAEKQNLKRYLEKGGFIYIEDCGGLKIAHQRYGTFSTRVKREIESLFPNDRFSVLPNDHLIYHLPYDFDDGLPNIYGVNNDGSAITPSKKRKGRGGEALIHDGRMVAFFSDADNCCAWGSGIFGDLSYRMGANIITYMMTH